MDFSKYKKLEFRRRVFAIAPTITMFDPLTNTQLGYIRMKIFSWRNDIRLFTDQSMLEEIIRIKARRIASFNMSFDIFESNSDSLLCTLQHRGLRSIFKRDYWNLQDKTGTNFGAIKETSGWLAMARRWIILVPYVGIYLEAILAFTPQTFDLLAVKGSELVNAGNIVHRKNPIKVKMDVDYSNAVVSFDPHVYIAGATLLAILDARKRS